MREKLYRLKTINGNDEGNHTAEEIALLTGLKVCTVTDAAKRSGVLRKYYTVEDTGEYSDPDFVWIEVTDDKYEMVINMADTATELARLAGVHPTAVFKAIERGSRRFQKVRLI